jgi:pimeloyl-ACP methyl ester carboxylesterase
MERKIMKKAEYHPFKSQDAKEQYTRMYETKMKEWPVPFQSKIIDTPHGQTFVQISGPISAPALVLLTGLGGNSLSWIPHIKELSEHFRTYAVDNINDIGLSVNNKVITDQNDFTAWLDELFTLLNLENSINMLGISYGGWLAGEYALLHPERLNKIVMVAPVATVQPISKEFMAKMAEVTNAEGINNLITWLYNDFLQTDKENHGKIEAMMGEQMIATSYFETREAHPPRVFEDPELRSIQVPTLFVIGENEKIYSAQDAVKRLNTVSPQINTEIIESAGHDLMHAKRDEVIKKVLEFLESDPQTNLQI